MLIALNDRFIGGLERKISKLLIVRNDRFRGKTRPSKISASLIIVASKDCMVRCASAVRLCGPDNKQRSTKVIYLFVCQDGFRGLLGREVHVG